MNTFTQWPPRRCTPGCMGDCQQGRKTCELERRAATDPSLPLDEPEGLQWRDFREAQDDECGLMGGLVVAIVFVAALAAVVLIVIHFTSQPEPVVVPVVSIKGMA